MLGIVITFDINEELLKLTVCYKCTVLYIHAHIKSCPSNKTCKHTNKKAQNFSLKGELYKTSFSNPKTFQKILNIMQ